tara:strand:+ start:75 stop:299 length:225 start_codon:yes stop_codon:yes gene_type:complete
MNDINSKQSRKLTAKLFSQKVAKRLDKIIDDLDSDSDYLEIYEAAFQVGWKHGVRLSKRDCHIIAIHLGREPNE